IRPRLGADLGHAPAVVGRAGKAHHVILPGRLRLFAASEGVVRRTLVAGSLAEDGTQPPDDEYGQGEKDNRRDVESVLHGLSVVSSPGQASPTRSSSVRAKMIITFAYGGERS